MKIFLSTLIVLFFFAFPSKISSQSDGEKLVMESIKFHDPKGNWGKFKSYVSVNSIVERNGKIDSSSRNLFFDLAQNQFEMKYRDKGDDIHYYLDDNNCFVNFLKIVGAIFVSKRLKSCAKR